MCRGRGVKGDGMKGSHRVGFDWEDGEGLDCLGDT